MPTKSDRRWLVLGANGMLGSEVMAQLDGRQAKGIDLPQINITDSESVRSNISDVDVVVNCAAYTAVDDAETNEGVAFMVNAVGPGLLAARCAQIGAKFVQISTDYVFDGERPDAYPEDFELSPKSAYGRTKAAGEWAVRAELPADSWVLRTAWLYGANGPNFVKTMVKLEATKPELTVVNDQHGQPTWARDVAERLVAVVENDVPAGIYHTTSTGETSWFGLTREIFSLADADPDRVQPTTTANFPRPAPRPANSVLGHEKWTRVGLNPLPPWEESLGEAWATGAFADDTD
jgi:dTDP-4-dehydrorhamnose reductase